MLADLLITLVLSTAIGIGVKLWFGELGFSSFPVLTGLTVIVLSYMATFLVHSLLSML